MRRAQNFPERDFMELVELLNRHGQVEVRRYADSGSAQESVEYLSMGISELAEHIVSGVAQREDMYLANHDHSEAEPADYAAFQTVCRRVCGFAEVEASLGLQASTEPLSLWFGPAGHREQLHYDTSDNLHVCVTGRKSWRLFPPTLRNLIACRPFSVLGDPSVSANFASRTADESLAHGAHDEVTVTLEPGDTIWVPANWWHEVTGMASVLPPLSHAEGCAMLRGALSNSVLTFNQFRDGKRIAGPASAWQHARMHEESVRSRFTYACSQLISMREGALTKAQ